MIKKINIQILFLISFFILESSLKTNIAYSQVFLPVDLIKESDGKLPVHSIFVDKDNHKWIGTEKGVFQIEEVTEEALVNANEFLPKMSILHIKKAVNDKIWFVTYSNEVIILDIQTNEQIKQNFDFLNGKIISNLLFSDNSKTVWVASRGNGLWKKTGANSTKIEVKKNDETINDIVFFNGMLFAATETGLYYTKNISTTDKKHKFKSVSGFTKGSKMIVYKNQLWVLGYDKKDKGTLKTTKDGKKWTIYSLSAPFEYQVPNIMEFDSKGNLWVAADRVAKFEAFATGNNKKWTEFGEKQGFQSNSALSLAIDKNDNIWVGTEGRGLFVRVNYPEKLTEKEENTEQEIESIADLDELKEEKNLSDLLNTEEIETIKGKKLRLKVQFKTAKADILPEYEEELNELVIFMNKNTEIRILIEGHTAPVGNAQKNQELSEQRASEVRNYLIQKGISQNRIRTVGYGGNRPISTNPEQIKENRRVEVIFVD
ncbi:outer membrane protein/peptidoglycan-associated (lipo)protein [Bernardetia litoralis DSM 6794]|uniref:Outer membrane protein/peptidoglycan-associated (Lipo)protein n=1 Tax=Bernardetia litoralis (strain ATCC 23117 / DSM 6794 / NBRC 15988 / NCIMB 1366 / Fx l1 / Sio-4) TaxID=880071 RepID=I4AKE5_BERLS|nr:OmpA family protein [Bernardetia litoralis]AFM04430.1 outer membrane protein/peptidoglycan-associated (lipo)protein [Bernardetia litoralis DSM 6794]